MPVAALPTTMETTKHKTRSWEATSRVRRTLVIGWIGVGAEGDGAGAGLLPFWPLLPARARPDRHSVLVSPHVFPGSVQLFRAEAVR